MHCLEEESESLLGCPEGYFPEGMPLQSGLKDGQTFAGQSRTFQPKRTASAKAQKGVSETGEGWAQLDSRMWAEWRDWDVECGGGCPGLYTPW